MTDEQGNGGRTVAVRLNDEEQVRLERWKQHIGVKTDSEAIRTALMWLERHAMKAAAS